jgi:hypothetical protein
LLEKSRETDNRNIQAILQIAIFHPKKKVLPIDEKENNKSKQKKEKLQNAGVILTSF